MATGEIAKTGRGMAARGSDVFSAMRDEMERMIERFERGFPMLPRLSLPTARGDMLLPEVDVHENSQQFLVDVDLPGVNEKDVSVTLANGVLTIKGEKKSEREETKDNYFLAERSYGSFERSLRLPETVDEDKVEARFEKGVLKIIAQKKPEAVKSERKIEVRKA